LINATLTGLAVGFVEKENFLVPVLSKQKTVPEEV
jgi:hypothetical protein